MSSNLSMPEPEPEMLNVTKTELAPGFSGFMLPRIQYDTPLRRNIAYIVMFCVSIFGLCISSLIYLPILRHGFKICKPTKNKLPALVAKRLTTPYYYIILSMGLNDNCNVLVYLIQIIVGYIYGESPELYKVRYAVSGLSDGFWHVFGAHLVVAAVNRFVNTVCPHSKNKIFSMKLTRFYIAACWIIPIAHTSIRYVPSLNWQSGWYPDFCSYGHDFAMKDVTPWDLVDIVINASVIGSTVLIYICISIRLRVFNLRRKNNASAVSRVEFVLNSQQIWVLCIFTCLYVVCITYPNIVEVNIIDSCLLGYITMTLILFNFSINPLIYLISSRDLRDAVLPTRISLGLKSNSTEGGEKVKKQTKTTMAEIKPSDHGTTDEKCTNNSGIETSDIQSPMENNTENNEIFEPTSDYMSEQIQA